MAVVALPSRAAARQKQLGAYYTDAVVADFLLRWALNTGHEQVLDPSFGGGVFLLAALQHLGRLGGAPGEQIYGIEIDGASHARFLAASPNINRAHLLQADFFAVSPGGELLFDVVVGNPPFIRYQRFAGETRRTALRCAEVAGVRLSNLASAWAPFLVHATQFVRPSGKLAMVAPAELMHAGYARPVLAYLRKSFGSVHLLSFSRRLFPRLSEDTILVLAAGRGEPPTDLRLVDVPGPDALRAWSGGALEAPSGAHVDAVSLAGGHERLVQYLLPKPVRDLYRQVATLGDVQRLGDAAHVGTGYVTGDNAYFHLDRATAERFALPGAWLRPAVRRGSHLQGLCFARADWEALHAAGEANLLLHLPAGAPLSEGAHRYLADGVARGVPTRFKCRVRTPWYRVPHVHQAPALLTYMSGSAPRLVVNAAGAVAPNTLHLVRPYPLAQLQRSAATAGRLAVAWHTSLTALSAELEGHSLGGGMLKMEPREAGNVLVALPDVDLDHHLADLDRLVRAGQADEARERADDLVLRRGLGLTTAEISALRDAWRTLQRRRLRR